MPTYIYETTDPSKPKRRFELHQSMKDDPLRVDPKTGEPVRRVFSEPNAPRAWTDSQGKAAVSDKNLASKGFTKYVKTGNGTYEKTAGAGPKKLKRGE